MWELGGTGGNAAAMTAASQGDVTTLSEAMMACGLDMGTRPPSGPTPGTATPQPPPEPTKAASTPTPQRPRRPQPFRERYRHRPRRHRGRPRWSSTSHPSSPRSGIRPGRLEGTGRTMTRTARTSGTRSSSLRVWAPVNFKTDEECQVALRQMVRRLRRETLGNAGYLDVDHMVPFQKRPQFRRVEVIACEERGVSHLPIRPRPLGRRILPGQPVEERLVPGGLEAVRRRHTGVNTPPIGQRSRLSGD